jgi:hypothetical protein
MEVTPLYGIIPLNLKFSGVKGAEVPLRKVGDGQPPYRNLFIVI